MDARLALSLLHQLGLSQWLRGFSENGILEAPGTMTRWIWPRPNCGISMDFTELPRKHPWDSAVKLGIPPWEAGDHG